jgi:hypothetical protein
MSMIEAECTRCKDIFVPHGVQMEDLIHGETEAGECGGIGVIQGFWYAPGEGVLEDRLKAEVLAQEKHGQEFPNCADSDCEFHHPELIER